MRPATIRRLLVFGVCALGVAALYVVPALDPATVGPSADQSDRRSVADQPPVAFDGTAQLAQVAQPVRLSDPTPAADAEPAVDREPPSTVSELSFPAVTAERLTVRWPAASDNMRVATYQVWLNGFPVAETTSLQVTVPWFKDGSREQVVQVRAVDTAGNQSVAAPAQLVERPAPVVTAAGGAG